MKCTEFKLAIDVLQTLPIAGSILVKLADIDLTIYDIHLSFSDIEKFKLNVVSVIS